MSARPRARRSWRSSWRCAELLLWSRAWHRLRAALAIGAGTHHLSIDGQGAPGFASGNQSVVVDGDRRPAPASRSNVHPHLMLALDARAVENWPATDGQHRWRADRAHRPPDHLDRAGRGSEVPMTLHHEHGRRANRVLALAVHGARRRRLLARDRGGAVRRLLRAPQRSRLRADALADRRPQRQLRPLDRLSSRQHHADVAERAGAELLQTA